MTAHEYLSDFCSATVFPAPSEEFNPRKDAEALRAAMKNAPIKGFGVDNDTIIDILTSRGIIQRLAIANAFKTLYGKSLVESFNQHLTGDFLRVAVALMTPLDEFYAQELHWAMAGPGTSEKTLIEILCTLGNTGIHHVASAYERLYGKSLEQDLKDETSFYFQRLLVSACQGRRDERDILNMDQVVKDAEDLYLSGEARMGTDETVFNAVMVSRSYAHLREVFKEYAKIAGKDIADAISSEFSGDIKEAHLTIVRCVRSRAAYYAQRLYKSMKGLGTDDRTLTRIIVGRSEIDLADIKRKFEEIYGETLEQWVKDDTSGIYRKTLLRLLDPS